MRVKAAAIAAALFLTAGEGWASTLSVTPIRLVLSPESPLGTFTVINEGPVASRVQLILNDWKQAKGADVLTPSREVLVNPTIFEVPGNGRQIVRLGLRVPALPTERSYRLVMREIPTAAQLKTNTIGVLLQISVPLFVPVQDAKANLVWHARAAPHGVDLLLDNKGRRHAQFLELTVTRDGKTVGKTNTSTYVLPDSSGHVLVPLTAPVAAGDTLRVDARTDDGSIQASVRVDGS